MALNFKDIETVDTDFLIIGTGVAGLRAAIEASKNGRVTLVTKGGLQEGCTWRAQGGIAVAISEDDTAEMHVQDTLRAGAGLCDEEAVKILIGEGISAVEELLGWGARFDRIGGRLAFTIEGAHQVRRVIHATGDATGEEIHRTLLARSRQIENIEVVEHAFCASLAAEGGECSGAVITDGKGRLSFIRSSATILASGGSGQIYENTTNPSVATGDGFAAAYNAGCELLDLEFVQFHPTVLYIPPEEPFLISEAARGEGGILRDSSGKQFMESYHPMGELAPRDVVSRAIFDRMHKTNSPNVYLDLGHLKPEFIKKRFPNIYRKCKSFGLDICADLIPVKPAAHFAMGGIKTNYEAETGLPRLFACGEVACVGVHGANRLASNSLLEGLVFGRRAGASLLKYLGSKPALKLPGGKAPSGDMPESEVLSLRRQLKSLMEQKVGIIRCRGSLSECLDKILVWDETVPFSWYNKALTELRNMITVALLTAGSALRREESRGAHYRSDFPETDDAGWKKHTAVRKGKTGQEPG